MPPDILTTIEVRPHPTKGRALYSLKPFNPGQPIHAFSNPLILHPSLSHLTTVCTHCLRPGSPRACSRCHAAYYCDAACQHAGWAAIHSKECKSLRQRRLGTRTGAELPTPVRALVQVLLKTEVEDGVKDLEGHLERKRNSKGWRDLEMMALAACAFAGMGGDEGDVRKAVDLLCKIQTNAFHRYDVDLGQVGIFLEPMLAMANHSCIPNAMVQFIGRKAVLRTERPILAGDEIEISYSDYTMPLARRQKALLPYSFECCCPRCKDDLNVYQVWYRLHTSRFNTLSVVSDLSKLKDHRATSDANTISIGKRHSKELSPLPEARNERHAALLTQYTAAAALISNDLWAISPVPQILTETSIYFAEGGEFAHALAIACLIATTCDPIRYASPFHPVRVKNLFMIAKLLANTAENTATLSTSLAAVSTGGSSDQAGNIEEALANIDQVSLCQMLLLMVLKLAPADYLGMWELCESARDMLEDIATLPGRERELSLINSWRDDGASEASRMFFDYAVVKQVGILGSLGREVLRMEFGSL